MSLLKITTTPIEYEIKTERARLQKKDIDPTDLRDYAQQARNHARVSNSQSDPERVQQVKQSSIQTNNYQNVARSRASGRARVTAANDIINNSTTVSTAVNSTTAPSSALQNAQAMSGVELSIDRQIDFASGFSQTNFSVNSDMFVQSVDLNTATGVNEWEMSKSEMEYVSGRFHMDIIQYPKVSIEYNGDFAYFPSSAAPDFEG